MTEPKNAMNQLQQLKARRKTGNKFSPSPPKGKTLPPPLLCFGYEVSFKKAWSPAGGGAGDFRRRGLMEEVSIRVGHCSIFVPGLFLSLSLVLVHHEVKKLLTTCSHAPMMLCPSPRGK
jgi:hypothetical protein